MALTKSFKELVQRRVASDAAFAENLLREGIDTMLAGDVDTGKAILRDTIKDGGKDSYQIITHGQLRWSDASPVGAAAARTAAARAPMTYLARSHRTG